MNLINNINNQENKKETPNLSSDILGYRASSIIIDESALFFNTTRYNSDYNSHQDYGSLTGPIDLNDTTLSTGIFNEIAPLRNFQTELSDETINRIAERVYELIAERGL